MNKDQDIIEGAVEQQAAPEKKASSALVEFLDQFEREALPEEKIRQAIYFMRTAISQVGTPRFKDFWEVRRLCLPCFKENLNQKVRVLLWNEYIELSGEARRIKEILDEQSTFAAEQIELAITALEKDQSQFTDLLEQCLDIDIPEVCSSLLKRKGFYIDLQKELNLLNTMASRINALRKEVVKTEMRVRYKNKFFDRLSASGDKVFPRRKELIKTISEAFIQDVMDFLSENFDEDMHKMPPLFVLREEIKALQLMAKELTLNTQAFTETRLHLSKYWDKIRDLEKERKKDFAQKKQSYKQNFDLVMEKITSFEIVCQNPEVTLEEVNAQMNEIGHMMKSVELGREEVKLLRDRLYAAKRPATDKFRQQEEEKERLEREEDLKRQERIQQLREQLTQLIQEAEHLEITSFVEKRDAYTLECERLSLNKMEKQLFDRLFKQIKDIVTEKKQQAILSLSEDDLEALETLKEALQERKRERQEIRDQLEYYRKALAGSGLDFEKAMSYGEFLELEKIRLEKATVAIQEIEEKISEFEG